MCISLLQPSTKIMQLFDDIILLAEGWVAPAAQRGCTHTAPAAVLPLRCGCAPAVSLLCRAEPAPEQNFPQNFPQNCLQNWPQNGTAPEQNQHRTSCLQLHPARSLRCPRSRILYHGPVDAVLKHFSVVGFDCPSRKEPPSFLQARAGASDKRVGWPSCSGRLAAGAGQMLPGYGQL